MNQPSTQEQNTASTTLTEKDLHCIARHLQGPLYYRDKGFLFIGCSYCLYEAECIFNKKNGRAAYAETVQRKLMAMTGVYLGDDKEHIDEHIYECSRQQVFRPCIIEERKKERAFKAYIESLESLNTESPVPQ